jgi:glucose-6-phosphate 1-dehydrogenase
MKKILAIAALLFSTSALADKKQDNTSLCKTFSSIAVQIMTARQEGVPLVDLLEIAAQGKSKDLNVIAKKLVIAAYEEPRFKTPQNVQRTIDKFRDQVTLDCVKNAK